MQVGLKNLSKTEKMMLSILGIIIICFVYYELGYQKLVSVAENKLNEKNDIEQKYNNAIITINAIEGQKSNLKVLNSQIKDKTDSIYPVISQEHLIFELDKILKDCNMEGGLNFNLSELGPVDNITPSENNREGLRSNVEEITQEYKEKNGIKNNDKEISPSTENNANNNDVSANNEQAAGDNISEDGQNSEAAIIKMKGSVKFSGGNYEDTVKFLTALKERQKKICVYCVNMEMDDLENVKGEFKVIFYSIPKLNNEKNDYLKWNMKNVYGKAEPFQFDSTAGTKITGKIPESDFVVSAKPLESNIPTVALGRAGDGARNSYVYADGNNVQEAEIILSKVGNKYYYKYKTANGSVPADYSNFGTEFIPYRGAIDINIMSEPRISKNDKSGIKLNVTNNTDKLLKINISGDDKKNPRVSIDGNKKNVVVSKE